MFYQKSPAADPGRRRKFQYRKFVTIAGTLFVLAAFASVSPLADLSGWEPRAAAQSIGESYRRELETGDKVSISVKSRNGRVSVIASEDQKKNVTLEASSTGAVIDPGDVNAVAKG